MTAFSDLKVTMDDLRVCPAHTEYHWTLTGINTGPGGTGHKICIRGLEKWSIGTDGLIASSQGYFDAAEYQRQLQQGT
jgi:hypothetical protein